MIGLRHHQLRRGCTLTPLTARSPSPPISPSHHCYPPIPIHLPIHPPAQPRTLRTRVPAHVRRPHARTARGAHPKPIRLRPRPPHQKAITLAKSLSLFLFCCCFFGRGALQGRVLRNAMIITCSRGVPFCCCLPCSWHVFQLFLSFAGFC